MTSFSVIYYTLYLDPDYESEVTISRYFEHYILSSSEPTIGDIVKKKLANVIRDVNSPPSVIGNIGKYILKASNSNAEYYTILDPELTPSEANEILQKRFPMNPSIIVEPVIPIIFWNIQEKSELQKHLYKIKKNDSNEATFKYSTELSDEPEHLDILPFEIRRKIASGEIANFNGST